MKKKKILIVNKSFGLGGIQSSMVNMANMLSKDYDIDMFIYHPVGVMKDRVDDRIKVLAPSWRINALGMTLKEAIKTKKIKVIAFRVFATIWTKLFNNDLPIKRAIRKQTELGKYDIAIAYHQEQRKKSLTSGFTRFIDERVVAKRKVAWIHYDSNAISLDNNYNNKFYGKMDKIVCVSKSLMNNFEKNNPALQGKVDYCYNFVNYDNVIQKSLEEQVIKFPANEFVCFSACRLSEEKGLPRAIKAMADVFKQNKDVVWYIAGDGIERENIEDAIKEYKLQDQIILIGNQSNPYTYMKNADLVINVSYHEAAPMVYLESKALGVPMFATETSSTRELLDKNASFICENTEEGIKEKFSFVINNRAIVEKAKNNLKHYVANNEQSFAKIEELIG